MSDRTKPRYFWVDDFRDYANNSILYSVSRYWRNTGGTADNGTDILYRVLDSIPSVSEPATRGKWLRLYDNNASGSILLFRDLDKNYKNFRHRLRCYLKAGVSGTVVTCALLQTSTAIAQIRFQYDAVNNWFDIYAYDHGTGFVDTGINIPEDQISLMDIIVNENDEYRLIIDNTVSTTYDTAPMTAGINVVNFISATANTGVDFFFDFLDIFEDTKGLQFYDWVQSAEGPTSKIPVPYSDVVELKSGRLLFTAIDAGVRKWYYSDAPYSTWNDTGLSLNLIYAVSATLLTNETIWILGGSAGGGAYYAYYSTNQGVSWTAQNITPTTGHVPLFVFTNGTNAYIVTGFSSAAPTSIVTVYKDVAGTWTSMATYTIAENRGLGASQAGCAPGFYDGSNYYFGLGYGNIATGTVDFLVYNEGAGTLTKLSTIDASSGQMLYYIPLSRSSDSNAYYAFSTAPNFRLYESRDQGATWTVAISASSSQIYRMNRRRDVDHLTGTNINARVWSFNAFPSLNLYYINEGIDYILKYRQGDNIISDIYDFITPTGTVFTYDNSLSKARIYTLVERSSILDQAKFEYFGYEVPARGELVVDPDFISSFATGDVLEFWDGYGNFIGVYKAQDPVWNENRGWVIQVVALWYDLYSRYSGDFSAKTTKQILQTIINALKFVYEDNSIDPTPDFITTYDRRVNEPVTHFIQNWVRQYERALFYIEPDSKARCHRYDRMIETGLRFHTDHPQIRNISDYRQPDIRLTTSDVIGGWYNTPNGKKELFINYIGDSELLATENEVIITKQDDQVRNYNEGLKLATNRFNIFNPQTLFVHLYVTNQGFIQPGESIHTSWSDPINNVSIPLQDLLFLYARYDAKNDIYEEMILTSNIVTEAEYYRVKQESERDTTLVSTYSDGDTPATAQQTATRPNPVNRLRSGTYEPRRPEASAPDWDETTLTDDTNWNDLDLSSILPEGLHHADLAVEAYDNLVGATIEFREKGLTGSVQRILLETTITNRLISPTQVTVQMSEARVIQIRVTPSPSNWGQIDITVLGGWI